MKKVAPVACQHIADYYTNKQSEQPCIGHMLLAHGYQQFSNGEIEAYQINNLYWPTITMQQ